MFGRGAIFGVILSI